MKPGDIIFLSGSVPWREGWTKDAKPVEIEEAIVSIARAVFARKGRLLFGGHPSVSPLIASIAGEYFPEDPGRVVRPVVTFQSEFYKGKLPDETWLMHRLGWSAIEWTPIMPPGSDMSEQEESLRLMRRWMLLGPELPKEISERNKLRPPKAMIAVGGMEGVRDEAAMFLDMRHEWDGKSGEARVYAVTSGGGAAERLMESPERWKGRLWLNRVRERDAEFLTEARASGDLVGLEDAWKGNPRNRMPADLPFQPYSAIVQWLLDEKV